MRRHGLAQVVSSDRGKPGARTKAAAGVSTTTSLTGQGRIVLVCNDRRGCRSDIVDFPIVMQVRGNGCCVWTADPSEFGAVSRVVQPMECFNSRHLFLVGQLEKLVQTAELWDGAGKPT